MAIKGRKVTNRQCKWSRLGFNPASGWVGRRTLAPSIWGFRSVCCTCTQQAAGRSLVAGKQATVLSCITA
eukprot:9945-Heterococcus_DN1.PRE.2